MSIVSNRILLKICMKQKAKSCHAERCQLDTLFFETFPSKISIHIFLG